MKKRLICMLLTVLMLVSVIAGTGISANAETVAYSTMTYRMASGDYVLRICQKLGLNYYVCKDAIMKLNNISENQWRFLPVGKLLVLPATDADAVVIMTGHGSTVKPTTATTPVATVAAAQTATTTAASTTTAAKPANTSPMSKDICWWYLVPYRLGAGETVTDACNALGVSFYQYSDTIKKVNKIKNWGNISAGTELWIPTIAMPKAGTNCIIVMRHIMEKGETAYGVMNERGLDYNATKPLLQIINETHRDLAKFNAGDAFFYPVSYTIPLNKELHEQSTGTGSTTSGTSSSSSSSSTSAKKYKLSVGFETGAGTAEFYVGKTRVYEASAGETVKVVINATAGRAVKDVIIRHSNGQADLYLNAASFVMPSCDITVDATFMKGHKIEVKSNYLDKALTLVDGVAVNSAAKGAAVLVASADPSLAIDELYVSYMTYDGLKTEKITNIDDGFVMPDVDVKVEVVLKPLPTYSLFADYVAGMDQGTFAFQVDGSDVTKAARGAQVTITARPNTGYTIGNIQFFDPATGNPDPTIGVFSNTFTMPARDVGVRVTFIGRGNNILVNPVEGGAFWAAAQDLNGNWVQVREAQTNAQVIIASQAEAGYTPSTNPSDYIVTRNSDGLRVPVYYTDVDGDSTADIWFRMPAGGVTVTGKFNGANALSYTAFVFLDGVPVPANTFSGVSFFAKGSTTKDANGNALPRAEFQDGVTGNPVAPTLDKSGNAFAGAPVPATIGEYIELSYDGGSKIVLEHYDILVNGNIDANLTNEARLNACFQMPNNNVVINAYFTSGKVKIAGADLKIIGSGTVGMLGWDDLGNLVSVDGVKVGQPFALTLSPSEGYFFNTNPADGKARIRVVRKDNGGEILPTGAPTPGADGEWIYSFASMPDCGVTVEVTFDKIAYWVRLNTVDEFGNPLNAAGNWKIIVNKTDTVVENTFTDVNINYGDQVSFALTEAGASKYTFISSIINDVTSKDTSFKMTGALARTTENLNNAGNPLVVTLVLKDKALSGHKNPIALKAKCVDAKNGTAGFVIWADSPYNPRAIDQTAFVTEAYAGDTVAVVPQPVTASQYEVASIRVTLNSGHYIDLDMNNPVDVSGQKGYTFVMPEGGYGSIVVKFVPVKYKLTVETDPSDAAKGLFQVSYNDGSSTSDVLLTTSFKDVPYGSTVKVTITEAGKAAGVKISDLTFSPDTKGAAEASQKPLTGPANSFTFKMPDEATTLTVHLVDKNGTTTDVPRGDPDPTPIELPATATVTEPASHGDLTLTYSYTDGTALGSPAKPNSGETVKVEVTGGLAAGEKLDGPIVIKDSNGNTLLEVEDGDTFEVPYTTDTPITAEAKVAKLQFKVTVNADNIDPADCDMTVEVKRDGGVVSTYTVKPGTTLSPNLMYGDELSIDVPSSNRDIEEATVNGTASGTVSGKKVTGVKIEPAGVADGGAVDVTVKFATNKYTLKHPSDSYVEFYEDAACTKVISEADENQTVYIKGTVPAGKYVKSFEITTYTIGAEEISATDNVASFQVKNHVTDAKIKATDETVITVKVTYKNAPSGLKTEVLYNSAVVGETVSDVKSSVSSDVQVKLHDPAGYKFKLPTSTKFSDNGSATTPVFTIDWANVNNGETVTIELDFVKPMRTLPTATSGGTAVEFYDNSACSGTPITNAEDGSTVYFKVTGLAAEKYLTGATIKSTAVSVSNDICGPYTVTEDLVNADLDIEAPYKSVKLLFDYKDGADSKVELYNGSALQTNNSSIMVSSNGSVSGTAKLGDVKLSTTTTTFGTVKGTNVTVTKNGTFDEVTFALDWAKLKNGATVTIEVNVD